MGREDKGGREGGRTGSLPWMAKFDRNAWPKKIIWRQAKGITSRFYWLQIPEKHLAKGQRITAAPAGRPKADHEAGGQQNTVPMDCDAA